MMISHTTTVDWSIGCIVSINYDQRCCDDASPRCEMLRHYKPLRNPSFLQDTIDYAIYKQAGTDR